MVYSLLIWLYSNVYNICIYLQKTSLNPLFLHLKYNNKCISSQVLLQIYIILSMLESVDSLFRWYWHDIAHNKKQVRARVRALGCKHFIWPPKCFYIKIANSPSSNYKSISQMVHVFTFIFAWNSFIFAQCLGLKIFLRTLLHKWTIFLILMHMWLWGAKRVGLVHYYICKKISVSTKVQTLGTILAMMRMRVYIKTPPLGCNEPSHKPREG